MPGLEIEAEKYEDKMLWRPNKPVLRNIVDFFLWKSKFQKFCDFFNKNKYNLCNEVNTLQSYGMSADGTNDRNTPINQGLSKIFNLTNTCPHMIVLLDGQPPIPPQKNH